MSHREGELALPRPSEGVALNPAPPSGQVGVSGRHAVPRACRPALAPDVELIGPLQASGFREGQWLVRRGDRFLQVSELLYRVAEQIDGARTLDEVAVAVTATTSWHVTSDNVAQIIDLKLAPLGLVSTSGAARLERPDSDVSPFRISGRRQLISARKVGRASLVLAPLFSPVAVVPALALSVGMHAWLYFVHGAGESLHLALYTPAGLLIVLALGFCSALFHELGHAAALRYSGGRPGAIGGGFYLVYPTLFTNTSDAYRLGRAGRVRTDLGGIYFHLLFCLLLAAVSLASDQPLLLAVVVVIDLEVVYQFLPTARLDGYWSVADALGIPDPLGQARLRLAGKSAAATSVMRASAMQRNAAALLALYLAISLALVSAIVVLTIADLPQIAVRVADLARHHVTVLHAAVRKHELLAVIALAVQLLLLALIAIAICMLVYRSTRSVVGALRKWGSATRRRHAGAAALLASLALGIAVLWSTGFYWAPHVPLSPVSRIAPPAGTETVKIRSYGPVSGPVAYALHPPAGGRYARRWQNCGFYAKPVLDSLAVHSLARGAIWMAYPPTLPAPERALLHTVAAQLSFVLISPYRGLRSRLVLTAWGHRLALRSLADPRLAQFIQAFRRSSVAPEIGKPCTGGLGTPLQ